MWIVTAHCPEYPGYPGVNYEERISDVSFPYRFEALLWIAMHGGTYDGDIEFAIRKRDDMLPFIFTPNRRIHD